MNAPMRRIGVAVMVLFALLFLNLNFVQVVKANDYRTDPHNLRIGLVGYQRQRGSIVLADRQTILAQSVATNDSRKYQRKYPAGAAFAQVVGYQTVNGQSSGIERVENDFLSGEADALFTSRLKDMFTGNKTTGGNVVLTLSKNAQEKAYDDLVHNRSGAQIGAAVALDPSTGAILALASTPSYDPNTLASHDSDAVNKGERVILVDDLIATGGTAFAAIKLLERAGANVVGCAFVIDLPDLGGADKIRALGKEVITLVGFGGH